MRELLPLTKQKKLQLGKFAMRSEKCLLSFILGNKTDFYYCMIKKTANGKKVAPCFVRYSFLV